MSEQNCPICQASVLFIPRYPRYVCDTCVNKVVDSLGNAVSFTNRDIGGGLLAWRKNSQTGKFDIYDEELTMNPEVYVDGIACSAAEAHFGGVVVQAREIDGKSLA